MGAILYILLAVVLSFAFLIFYFFWVIITALTIYILQKVYPVALGIAEWVTARRNLLPFVLFMLITTAITVMLLIGAYYFTANVHAIGMLFVVLLILLLAVVAIIFDGVMVLAIIMWLVRLSHWAFAGFRKMFLQESRFEYANGLAPPRLKPSYRRRQRVEGPYPLVPSAEEKARQKAKAEARAKAQAKAKAIEKAMAKAQAKAKAIEKQRAKELAKAQAIYKARAKALAEAQAIAEGKAAAKKTKSEKTSKPKPKKAKSEETSEPKPKKAKSEETSKPKARRRRRPRPRSG